MSPQDAERPSLADARTEIAAEVLEVHQKSYGTGAGEVSVHILDADVFVVLDQLELSTAETTLLEAGHADLVSDVRAAFQRAIETTFRAIVERATGRRVTSFLSSTSIDSLYSVEIFRLAE
jgi:uncharacterized protein YbcI